MATNTAAERQEWDGGARAKGGDILEEEEEERRAEGGKSWRRWGLKLAGWKFTFKLVKKQSFPKTRFKRKIITGRWICLAGFTRREMINLLCYGCFRSNTQGWGLCEVERRKGERHIILQGSNFEVPPEDRGSDVHCTTAFNRCGGGAEDSLPQCATGMGGSLKLGNLGLCAVRTQFGNCQENASRSLLRCLEKSPKLDITLTVTQLHCFFWTLSFCSNFIEFFTNIFYLSACEYPFKLCIYCILNMWDNL